MSISMGTKKREGEKHLVPADAAGNKSKQEKKWRVGYTLKNGWGACPGGERKGGRKRKKRGSSIVSQYDP